MQYAALGAQRPPSRHKEPNKNLGLDLPLDDTHYVDIDSDDSFGFEIGLDNAALKQKKKDSENSLDRGDYFVEVSDDVIMNDFLNSSGNKRGISKSGAKNASENKRNLLVSAHAHNKQFEKQ